MKHNILLTTITLIITTLITVGCSNTNLPTSFDECVKLSQAKIAESYPRQCFYKNLNFIEEINTFNTDEKNQCKNKGGIYEKSGLAQYYNCNLPTSDFTTACTDSTQCEGLCLENGTCSKYTINFGCTQILENNKTITICID